MKFFKAFSLLHRRVKSTTFEPGPAGLPQFATPPKAKTFSSSGEAGQTRGLSGLSFFDLVTSNPPVVPPSYLNHISRDDASDRVLGLWPSRRHSDKGVLSTFQSSVKKECTRLTEAVNFWIAEYTKMQNLLKNCHAELLVERLKTGNLESKLKLDQEEIERLRAVLNHCEKASCPSAPLEDSDGIYTVVGNTLPACTRTRIPSLNIESCLSSQMSTGVNAPDQYNSALHMILVARKNLRDQRKISKYWKGQAVILGQQNTITPSVSTISSIRDTLPADRHLAVRALMAQRGISLRLAQLEEGGASPKAVHTDLQDSAAVSDKTISKKESISMLSYANSESSRLGPLASESLKQEVNMLFGPSSPSKRLFPSRSRQIGAVIASKSCSVKTGLSNLSRYSHNIESFGDINTLFQVSFRFSSSDRIVILIFARKRLVRNMAPSRGLLSIMRPVAVEKAKVSFPIRNYPSWSLMKCSIYRKL